MSSTKRVGRQMTRSILSNWATFIFSAGVNFFLSPLVVRSLGETEYGAWTLLVAVVGHLGLLDLGVRSAVTRYMAKFYTAGEHDRASLLYAAAIRIFAIAGATAFVLSLVMATLVGHVFNVPTELLGVARVVAVLGGINVGISLVSGVWGGVLIGLERFDYSNAMEVVIGIVRAIAVVVSLKTGHGLIALAMVQLVATILRALASIYYAAKLYPELHLGIGQWDRESALLILKYGLSASFLHVSSALMNYGDTIVLGSLLPVGMITYFAIAGNLSDYTRSLVSGVSQTLAPRISTLQAGGSQTGLMDALMSSARLSTVVVAPIAATFMVRGHSFIALWMGPSYADLSGRVLWVLAVAMLPISGYQIVSAAMLGASKHRGLIPIYIAECVANFVLSIILVRQFGVIGTAIGTLIPRLVVSAIVGPWYVRRMFGVPIQSFWLHAFLQPIIATIPFAIASFYIDTYWPARHLAVYFLQVLLILPLMIPSVWFIVLTSAERAAVSGAFVARSRRTA